MPPRGFSVVLNPEPPPPAIEPAVPPAVDRAVDPAVERAVLLAFSPLHKRAFGVAIGTAAAVFLALLTLVALVRDPEHGLGLGILRVYFRGYEVSWPGVVIGAAWGGLVGFVAGWFAAFCRNLVLAVWLIYVRAHAALAETRDFLDHI
jgi:hypothetical protein